MKRFLRIALLMVLFQVGPYKFSYAQFDFGNGPLPIGDTTCFTTTVSGIGYLEPPGWGWGYSISTITLNIITDHPQTLSIWIISPAGDTLMLSEFNGAGGQNYTNTNFVYSAAANIDSQAAPFNGYWEPEGGSLSLFDNTNANGIWTLCIADTAVVDTSGGGSSGGGPWTPGYFGNGTGGAGATIGFGANSPPCPWIMPSWYEYLCPGETVDINAFYGVGGSGFYAYFNVYDPSSNIVTGPVSTTGTYWIDAMDFNGCYYYATFDVYAETQVVLGPDFTVTTCTNVPINLTALVTGTQGIYSQWYFNGSYISTAVAANANLPGVYTLDSYNNGGCNDTLLITLNTQLAPDLGPDQSASVCSGTPVDLTPVFNVSLGSINEWTLGGIAVINPSAVTNSGVYTLITTEASGCSDTAEFTLNFTAGPSVGVDQIFEICPGIPIDLNFFFNTTGYVVNWTYGGFPVGNPSSVSTQGVYMLVASAGGSCSDTAYFTLNIAAPPNLGADQSGSTCNGNSIDLTTIFNTAGTTTASWTFNGNLVGNPASVTTSGAYMLVVTNASGCSDTAVYTLNILPAPALGADVTQSTCSNQPIDLSTIYNTAGYTATWTFNGNAIAIPTAVSTTGNYQVIATAGGGCSDTAVIALGSLSAPSLGANQVQSICSNSVVDLTSLYTTTGYTSSWTLNGNVVSNAGSINVAGTYVLIATSANGCSDTAQVTLNIAGSPSLGPDITSNICSNEIVDLTAMYSTGANTANWYLGGNPVVNPAAITNPGAYMLIITSPAGCSDTAIATVNSSPAPSLGSNQSVTSCTNTPLNLNGLYNTTGLVSSWTLNGSAVSNPASVNNSGTFILIATSAAGCVDTAEVALTVSAAPVLGANQSGSICSGNTQNLTNVFSVGNNSTAWSFNGNPVGNPNTVTNPGVYTLIASSAAGCFDTATYTLNVNPTPSIGGDYWQYVCSNNPIDLTTLYNTTGYTSVWSLNGSVVSNPSSINVSGNYMLVVTAAGGCTDTAEASLGVVAAPVLGSNQTVNSCTGFPVDLNSYFNIGTNNAAWTYNGNPVSNPGVTFNAGVYTLIATTDTAGCTDTATVTLNNLPSPNLGADQIQATCSNTQLDLTTLFNTTGYTATWYLNGLQVGNPGAVNLPGTYQVIAASGAGCADTAEVALSNLATPSLGTDQNVSMCNGLSSNLTSLFITSGYTIDWTLSGSTVADPTSVFVAGGYQLIAIDGSCSDTAIATVVVNPAPIIGSDQTISSCTGTLFDLTNVYITSGLNTAWTLGSNTISNPSSISTSGNYQLIAENNFGCSDTANVALTINQSPDLGPDQDVNLCTGNSSNLESLYSLSGLTATWNVNGIAVPDPTTVATSGNYQLIVTDNNGCVDSALTMVIVNTAPVLGSDQSHALCPWMSLNLAAIYNTSVLSTSVTLNNQPLANYSSVHDAGAYTIIITDQNGCTDEAIVSVSNMECLCEADFDYTEGCFQNAVSFELMADSAIESAHWNFENAGIPSQDAINPLVYFQSADMVQVTLEAKLSCGTVVVQKQVQMEDCRERCHSYIPNAFTPNNDGHNDWFSWYSDCQPEQFRMEILNRFGQVIFISEDPAVSWNGKDESTISPEGVYIYQVEYQLPYQDKQLLTGRLSLLR